MKFLVLLAALGLAGCGAGVSFSARPDGYYHPHWRQQTEYVELYTNCHYWRHGRCWP